MKRKLGFGPLKALTRRNAHATPEELWSDDEGPFSFEPTYDGRPPRLDTKVEAELRKACAIVLENLKPSGWDIEDTRMKSDILVDDPDGELAEKYLRPTSTRMAAQAVAAAASERNMRSASLAQQAKRTRGDPRDPRDRHSQVEALPQIRHAESRIYQIQPAQTRTDPKPSQPPQQHLGDGRTDQPYTRRISAQVRPPAQRTDSSSSTRSSSNQTSVTQPLSASTAATSAIFTPSTSSKRISNDTKDTHANREDESIAITASAAAAAMSGLWLNNQSSPTTEPDPIPRPASRKPFAKTRTDESFNVQPQANEQARSDSLMLDSYAPVPKETAALTDRVALQAAQTANQGTKRSAKSKKPAPLILDPKRIATPPILSPLQVGFDGLRSNPTKPFETNAPAKRTTSADEATIGDNTLSPQSMESSLPSAVQPPANTPVVPIVMRQDPPTDVHFMDARPQSNESIVSSSSADTGLIKSGLTSDPSSPRSPPTTGGESQLRPTNQIQFPLMSNHKPKIMQDFWQPAIKSPTIAAFHHRQVHKTQIHPADEQAADFDSLMSMMKESGESNMFHQIQNSPQLQIISPARESRRGSSDLIGNYTNGYQDSPRRVPSHQAIQYSKPKGGGLKKMLSRMGLRTEYQQQAAFLPPEEEPGCEDDDWYDNQACAAPVVGFGRGW